MLTCLNRKSLKSQDVLVTDLTAKTALKNALWIDLRTPSKEEEVFVEKSLLLNIPTRADMTEIELSSRLYTDEDNYFMTVLVVDQSELTAPILDPVSFVLTKKQLITVRHIHPQSFEWFNTHLIKFDTKNLDAVTLFLELLESMFDRLTDILESISRRLEVYSKSIFKPRKGAKSPNYLELMHDIGALGDLNSKVSESLMTFARLVVFFTKSADVRLNEERHVRLSSLSADLNSLSEHVNFFSNKITFLLEATLGFVNIDQNHIIKLVSVAAVIFLPPTLVMSFYGMNFHFMPELKWHYGYIYVIGLSVLSSWIPYKYFKYRKWI
jgi:magnesium transporter